MTDWPVSFLYMVLHLEDGGDCGGLRSLRSLRPLPQSTSSRFAELVSCGPLPLPVSRPLKKVATFKVPEILIYE